MTAQTRIPTDTPPPNSQRNMSWDDFPQAQSPETFELVSPSGDIHNITLGKGTLRVFKALVNGPLYAASPVRISDRILILKQDHGVNIQTLMFNNDRVTGRQRFGVYVLMDTARRLNGGAA